MLLRPYSPSVRTSARRIACSSALSSSSRPPLLLVSAESRRNSCSTFFPKCVSRNNIAVASLCPSNTQYIANTLDAGASPAPSPPSPYHDFPMEGKMRNPSWLFLRTHATSNDASSSPDARAAETTDMSIGRHELRATARARVRRAREVARARVRARLFASPDVLTGGRDWARGDGDATRTREVRARG